jgi:hypothetical protein
MRVNLSVFIAGVLLISTPALAGTVTTDNNQVTWQSTQCTAPAQPASVVSADRHSKADDMNKRVTAYNEYVTQVQAYMDCVSKEAQADASNANQSITGSAQKQIDETRKSVTALAEPLKN